MELKQLLEFIDWTLSQAGQGSFYRDQDMTKRIFAQCIKLNEEVWELSSEILWNQWFVRKEKLARYSQQTLMDEFADVIFTTIRLAKLINIDISQALENKMIKIQKRSDLK